MKDSMKKPNAGVIGVQRGENKENDGEKIFEDMIARSIF